MASMTRSDLAYRVREASSTDLRAVQEVLAENEVAQPPTEIPNPKMTSEHELETWARMMRTPDLKVYLAEIGDVPVGTATMLVMPNITYGCRPTAFIEAVVVKYIHRRRGVASRLMQRALDDARAAFCFKIQLLSHKRHAEDGAHRLYQQIGFEAEDEGFRLYLR
jgi:GNAT superfamily N-acetyltransferase